MRIALPLKRRDASTYAVGVPTTRTRSCASTVVFPLTISASVTTGLPNCAKSVQGETWTKIATIGKSRKLNPTNVAAKTPPANATRLTVFTEGGTLRR